MPVATPLNRTQTATPHEPWEVAPLATYLRVSERHLRRLIAERRVKTFRVGKRVLVSPDEVSRILREGC